MNYRGFLLINDPDPDPDFWSLDPNFGSPDPVTQKDWIRICNTGKNNKLKRNPFDWVSFDQQVSRDKLRVPWLEMLTSPPVWGTLITDCCNTWGIMTIMGYGPIYLKVISVIEGISLLLRVKNGGNMDTFTFLKWIRFARKLNILTF